MIRFTVPGRPVPWQRAGRGVRGSFTPKAVRDYQEQIREEFMVAVARRYICPSAEELWPTDREYSLTCVAYFADKRRRDCDNLGKVAGDALNKLAWADDAQITEWHVYKRSTMTAASERMEITIGVVG